MCHWSPCYLQLPIPRDIPDDELLKLLESDDPSGFRIPMSLGEPHAELDKGRAYRAKNIVLFAQ